MPDTIGNITVPEVSTSGTFPLSADYGYVRSIQPSIAVHSFGSGNAKIEQRFLLGDGLRRWQIGKSELSDSEVDALYSFWESRKGAYQPFTFDAPDGNSYTCRFANEPLTVERLIGAVSSCTLTLIEVPTTSETYSIASTVTRFPSGTLATALLSQVQQIIPLVKIVPLTAGYPAIYLSDRRVTVGGQLYQARLLSWDGIAQSLGNESDEARFTFGNADRVMRDLVNDVDLTAAVLEFSLFHVGATIKLDLWKGAVTTWTVDAGPEFSLTASDGIYEITLPYPPRKISRTCWKRFNDGVTCPFAIRGSLDLTHYPGASGASCDRGYDTANGCQAHRMDRWYGGVVAKPQGVRITNNGSGTMFKLGRSMVTATSLVADSIYGRPLKEVYTDIPMPVNCDIAAGRDESDFYSALGIVGEGPLGAYGTGHKLDGQYHHGYPGTLGLRTSLGNDPAFYGTTPETADTHFSLGQSGNQATDWTKEYVGASTYERIFAAGTAFLEMRRSDEKGIQLTKLDTHSMQAIVSQGVSGWMWTDASTRIWGPLINPVWVAVNALLRARGLRNASASVQVQYFNVEAAMGSAAVCDSLVTSLVTGSNETQFKFIGVIETEKPLRDWITEILANCLGYYTFSFGKLKIGIRDNSSSASAFTVGNMIWQSLKLAPAKPAFNQLTSTFADAEFEFVANSVAVQDDDHAALRGGGAGPLYLKGQLNLAGTASKSQAGRITAVRLREELGGINAAEWKKARQAVWSTTVLALDVEPGMVVSITDPDMPDGSGEFRITGWKLNRDYSIDLQGRTSTDSMYDLVAGPKPADVSADPVPPEFFPSPLRPVWHPNEESPSALDPIYDENDRTFGLTQVYADKADTSVQAQLVVTGKLPPNDTVPDTVAPVIRAYATSDTGGNHPDDRSTWVCVAARNANGEHSPHSNIIQLRTPAFNLTADRNLITLSEIEWPAGTWAGYTLFGCYDDGRLICEQVEQTGALPASIAWSGPASRSTYGLPSSAPKFVRAKAKGVVHSGPAYGLISEVSADRIICANLAGLADDWTGRVISVISDATDGSAALWNFRVTAHDPGTGEFVCVPDPQSAGVEVGDVAIIRARPDTYSATTVGDSKFINGLYLDGIAADERDLVIRILAGTGRGQIRRVASHTTTVYTVDRPFDVTPDATSIFIVEESEWKYSAESSPQKTRVPGAGVRVAISADNLLGRVMLVGGFLVDRDDNESPEDLSPVREIYLYGEAGPGGPSTLPDVPLVTDVTAGDPAPFLDQSTLKVAIPLHFVAPTDLGTGANRFSGYEVFCETPDGVVSCGKFPFASSAGSAVNLSAIVPYPDGPVSYWLYVASRSDEWQNPLTLHSRPSPTPNVMVAVAPFTGAPNVRKADAGRSLGDGTFAPEMYWDDRRSRMLIDTGCLAPANTSNFTGYQLWVQTPLAYVQVTGTIDLNSFTEGEAGVRYHYFNLAFELESIPATPESWDVIFVSLDHDGEINRDIDGNPTGPRITLDTLSKVDYVTDFDVELVHGRTDGGDQTYQLRGTWTNPASHRYKGQRFVMTGWGDEQPLFDSLENETSFVTAAKPKPDTPQAITVYAAPIYGDGTVGAIVPGVSPSVDLTIARIDGSAGVEYAPVVLDFSVTLPFPCRIINGDGQRVLVGDASWRNPSAAEYGGAILRAIWSDGQHITLSDIERGSTRRWQTPNFPMTAFTATFYLLSCDTNNHRNTYVPGVTPAVTINIPAIELGPLGTEYTSLVSSFSASVVNPTTSDGSTPAVITFTLVSPVLTDPTWADVELMEYDGVATRSRGKFKSSPFRISVPSLGSATSYTYYAVSRDVNGRANTLVIGVTPSVTVTVGSASGTFDMTKAKATSYDSSIFTISGGQFKIWAFDGSLIVSGSVSTSKLDTAGISVGGGGSKPGKIEVFNSSASLVAAIGVFTGGEGIWAQTGGFGNAGTGAVNPPFKADVSGNVSMTGATITLTGSSGTDNSVVLMDPSATYSIFRCYNVSGNETFARPGVIGVAAKDTYANPIAYLSRDSGSASVQIFAGSGVGSQVQFTAVADQSGESIDVIAGHLSSHYMRIQASGSAGSINFKGLELQVDGVAGWSGSHNGGTYSQGILISVP